MKSCLAFLLFMFSCSLQAQKLTVESFSIDTEDLAASVSPRLDRNGNPCGLVKVQLAMMGAQFDGNIIGSVDYKTGEYWVYLTQGTKLLHIKHPSFLPLELDFRQLMPQGFTGIQPKTTYKLIITIPAVMEIDEGMRYLNFIVTPHAAQVTVDNGVPQSTNSSDGSVSFYLPMGKHSWEVTAAGYAPKKGTTTIADKSETLNVDLQSLQSNVKVSCPTPKAQIYVNNNLRGASPWSGTLVPGSYRIEARREGYRSQWKTVVLEEKADQQVELPELSPITGTLNVNYTPIQSEVWIDGEKKGVSPDVFRGITVGSHLVELRKEGYTTKKETVTVQENKTTQLTGQLEKSVLAATTSTTASKGTTTTTPVATTRTTNSNTIQVKGKVVDNDGESIIGASVLKVGTNQGTVTNLDGEFTLMNVPRNSTIRISYVGYKSVEVRAAESLRIVLKKDYRTKVRFGISAGLNVSGAMKSNTNSSLRYQAGLDMAVNLKRRFGLETGLSISGKGFRYYDKGISEFDANYLHFPLQLTYTMYGGGILWKALAGPYIEHVISRSDDSDPFSGKYEISKLDYGLQFGLDLCVPQYFWKKLHLKVGYELGLKNQCDYGWKNKNFSVTLGYTL